MSDSEAAAETDSNQAQHQAGGEFADPNATVTCTTCFAEVKADNIGKHFDWHVDVGHHSDDAQRERPDTSGDDESSDSSDSGDSTA